MSSDSERNVEMVWRCDDCETRVDFRCSEDMVEALLSSPAPDCRGCMRRMEIKSVQRMEAGV